MIFIFLAALFVLFGLGTPVAFAIGLSSVAIFLLKGLPLVAVAQRMIGGLDNFRSWRCRCSCSRAPS